MKKILTERELTEMIATFEITKILSFYQTDRELAEMIAKFRTPPGFNWQPLADDIETLLKDRPARK